MGPWTGLPTIQSKRITNFDDFGLVFKFLQDIDACEEVGTHRYEFRREHMSAILGVEERVMEQRVEEYLREDDQSMIGSFTGDDTYDEADDSEEQNDL